VVGNYLLNKQMVVEGERAMRRIRVTVFGLVVYIVGTARKGWVWAALCIE
jgi:hypothetical protein